MKTRINAILLVGLLALFSSCDHDTIHAHGEVTSVYHDIEGYTGLRVSDAFQVYVHFSELDQGIRIAANDNLHDKIVVEKDGDELVIRLKSHTSIQGKAVMNAYITTPSLSTFRLGGASRLTLDDQWEVQDGKIGVSGASDFKGEVIADRLEVDLDGASSIDVSGSISFLDAELSGSSDLLDFGLDISNLDIDLSGASTAFLSVEETIRVKASGASTLNYKGNAAILKSELSGSSHVTKKD